MDRESFESIPRLDASDLHDQGQVKLDDRRLPLRIGTRFSGWIPTVRIGANRLQVTWSTENGRARQDQSIGIAHFTPRDGNLCTCFCCPDCGKLRKQLFLVNRETKAPACFSFVCQWCVDFPNRSPVRQRPGAGGRGRSASPVRQRHGASGRRRSASGQKR
jgi:hypothetical protein